MSIGTSQSNLCRFLANLTLRFADRDMIMRYHWGLAVGHVYSHNQNESTPSPSAQAPTTTTTPNLEPEPSAMPEVDIFPHELRDQENDPDADCPELGFENREDDLIEADEDYQWEHDGPSADYDDDESNTIDEMHHFSDLHGDVESYN